MNESTMTGHWFTG